MARCEAQLDRAGKLIGGLGGEDPVGEHRREPHRETAQRRRDVVTSSGVVAITVRSRRRSRRSARGWSAKMETLRVPHTPGADIQTTLADPCRFARGASRDCRATRCPSRTASSSLRRDGDAMIDPQGQANKWVKNMNRSTATLRPRPRGHRRHQAQRQGLPAHARQRHSFRSRRFAGERGDARRGARAAAEQTFKQGGGG